MTLPDPLEELASLRRLKERLQREEARAELEAEQARKGLKELLDTNDEKTARRKVQELEKESQRLEREFTRLLEEFKTKWGNKLGEL